MDRRKTTVIARGDRQLALFYDGVGFYVRSRLAPAQLTQADADAYPDIEVTARNLGTWGIHEPHPWRQEVLDPQDEPMPFFPALETNS